MTPKIAPASLFVYNRPDHTKRTLDALKNNALADQTSLIVFCDGPKTSEDEKLVKQVQDVVNQASGFKDIQLIRQEKNRGLAASIISGVTDVMATHGQGIIIEDDLVTSPHFLTFMNKGLNIFRDEERVISIHGYVYPVESNLPDAFFLRGADCWGWATWKRGWDLFEADSHTLIDQLESQKMVSAFNLDNSFDYMKLLRNQAEGKSSSWAIRWHASAFLKEKLTLYPGKSFVENIGVDGSGTHCGEVSNYTPASLATEVPDLSSIDISESVQARKVIAKYLKRDQSSYFSTIKKYVKRLIA